ncbi:hypothetical protein KIPB_003678 [Kipferlia bialata]|uniref:MI domain-containing protein n=1 Tax=Kipferlia bialata TaxID=797122 RepID=A0A391NK65_9EUKA|nr:hypothetical protein KIPB_003678 [Kipferlia bialata]|eukprot:g3678.t1
MGGYIPPHKRTLRAEEVEVGSVEYQRAEWDSMKRSLKGLFNRVNVDNTPYVLRDLFRVNLIRGRGLFAKILLETQAADPGRTPVYAALVAVVNAKLPDVGRLVAHRVVDIFSSSIQSGQKAACLNAGRFLAHLANQGVVNELLVIEGVYMLLLRPTPASVDVAVEMVRLCGQMLSSSASAGMEAVFARLREILEVPDTVRRIRYAVESLFASRRTGFGDFPQLPAGLALVDPSDQVRHSVSLGIGGTRSKLKTRPKLDWFVETEAPRYMLDTAAWERISGAIVPQMDSLVPGPEEREADVASSGEAGGDSKVQELVRDQRPGAQVEYAAAGPVDRVDMTDTDRIRYRRKVYLALHSSATHDEAVHKMLRAGVAGPGSEEALVDMLLDCVSQLQTYLPFFGAVSTRLCQLHTKWQDAFDAAFHSRYESLHQVDTKAIRNIARLYAHLLCCDALPWEIMDGVRLSESTTTASSRIFLKVLLLQCASGLGVKPLCKVLQDKDNAPYVAGLFPDSPLADAVFACDFFAVVGLGDLAAPLREFVVSERERERVDRRLEDVISEDESYSYSYSDD